MAVNVTKISQSIKGKGFLSIEKHYRMRKNAVTTSNNYFKK